MYVIHNSPTLDVSDSFADSFRGEEPYPEWCNLGQFYNVKAGDLDCEPHYHAEEEIWLWQEGKADAIIDGNPVHMRPGMMAYHAPGRKHEYKALGPHANVGINPPAVLGLKRGHLHTDEDGELPPEALALWFSPEENNPEHPAILPREAFLQSAYRGAYEDGEKVLDLTCESWRAILVIDGLMTGSVDGEKVEVSTDEALVISESSVVDLEAKGPCKLAHAVGWPEKA